MRIFFVIIGGILVSLNLVSAQTQHFYQHSTKNRDYYEFWDYQLALDNGTKVFLTYSLVNIPALGRKVAAELSLHNLKGKHPSVGRQFPISDWREDPSSSKITMRAGHFMENLPGVGHRVLFATSKNQGFLIDITFVQAEKSGKLHISTLGSDSLYLISHIPHGQVKGTIAVGSDTLKVSGFGSLVHSWHQKNISDLAQQSVFLLGSTPELPTAKLFAGKKSGILGVGTAKVNGQMTNIQAQSITAQGKVLTITWDQNVPATTIDLRHSKQSYSALTNIDSWIERQAARLVLGGDMILLRGASPAATGTMHWTATGF